MELSYFFQSAHHRNIVFIEANSIRRLIFFSKEDRANGIRVYTNKTCLRRLKKKTGRMELSDFFQSAEADIVCIDANSIRRLIFSAVLELVC
jgi:hypothetical protein